MTQENLILIGQATVDQLTFSTNMGATSLTVSDLMNERITADATLEALASGLQKAIVAQSGESIFVTKKKDTSVMEQKLALLKVVAQIRVENRTQAANAKREREKAKQKLSILMAAADKAEIAKIEAMSAEEIAAAIEAEEAKLK